MAEKVRPRIISAAHVAEMAHVVVPAIWTNVPDNLAVDRARDAVLQLEVHLGNRVFIKHRGVRDITWKRRNRQQKSHSARRFVSPCWVTGAIDLPEDGIRTDSRRLDHVADGEPLDGLVLGRASRAVGAPDGLDVAAACEISTSQRRSRSKAIDTNAIPSGRSHAHPSCCGRCSFSS